MHRLNGRFTAAAACIYSAQCPVRSRPGVQQQRQYLAPGGVETSVKTNVRTDNLAEQVIGVDLGETTIFYFSPRECPSLVNEIFLWRTDVPFGTGLFSQQVRI